jgi:hypothetical protein
VSSAHLPWLAFGYDRPHTFEFLNNDQLGALKKNLEQVEQEATRNVRLRKASWQATPVPLGHAGEVDVLLCVDDYFAAEKILDAGFLRAAQKQLKIDLLAVGIPRRGFLMAIDGRQSMAILGAFAGAVSAQYHRGDSPPITPAVFAVVDGKVVGLLQGGEDLGREAAPSEDEEEQDFYIQGLVLTDKATGLESVHICAGGANVETLGQAIEQAFRQVIATHLARAEFGGEIRVVILTEMTPPEVRMEMPSLEAHLQGVAREAGFRTAAGRPVNVRFEEHTGSET